jgi:hypothetical protein
VTLGYYALDNGTQFDQEWQVSATNPLNIHRIIRYNFLYHVDRDMNVSPKLNACWATHVTQPYLEQHNPSSLKMDTVRKTWAEEKRRLLEDAMDLDNQQGEWIPVSPS